MKRIALALAATGAFGLTAFSPLTTTLVKAGDRDHADYHDRQEHGSYHRSLRHRRAHRDYYMTPRSHGRLHDRLDHEAYHDDLDHRRYHRYRYGNGRRGYGFSTGDFSLWIGR